jgi:hypothetical protein
MEEKDIRAPLYYVMGRECDVEAARHVFAVTPCATGVVCSDKDREFIAPFVQQVFEAKDRIAENDLSSHLARTTGHPCLVVGNGRSLTAIYADGQYEDILC